jgi:hypothetical protein
MENLFGLFVVLLTFSAVIEASTKALSRVRDIIKNIVKKTPGEFDFERIVFMIVALTITIVGRIVILGIVWKSFMGEAPYFLPEEIDFILTGLLIARGSNPVHELLEKLKSWMSIIPK